MSATTGKSQIKSKRAVKSWLDDPKAAKKAAKKSTRERRPGRQFGAEHFTFALTKGNGEVAMRTFVGANKRLLVVLPASTVDTLKQATGGRYWSSAMVALATWAIEELRRQGKSLTITRGDPLAVPKRASARKK